MKCFKILKNTSKAENNKIFCYVFHISKIDIKIQLPKFINKYSKIITRCRLQIVKKQMVVKLTGDEMNNMHLFFCY